LRGNKTLMPPPLIPTSVPLAYAPVATSPHLEVAGLSYQASGVVFRILDILGYEPKVSIPPSSQKQAYYLPLSQQ